MSTTARFVRLIGIGLVAVVATSVLSPVEASASRSKTVTQKVSVTQKATVSQKATMSATVDGVTRRATRTVKHTAAAKATVKKKARATTVTKARSKARSAARKAATAKARKLAVARARSGAVKRARSAAAAAARQDAQRAATQVAPASTPTSFTVTDTQTVEQTVTVQETFVVEGHTGHGEATATASATVTTTETHPTLWEADYWATWNAYWEATAQAAAKAEAKARPIALARAEEQARALFEEASKPKTYTAVETVEQTVTITRTHTIGDVVGHGEATATASATVTHTEEAADLWEAYYWAVTKAHAMATEQAKAEATAEATAQAEAAAKADAEAKVAAQQPTGPAEPTEPIEPAEPTDPGAPTGPVVPEESAPVETAACGATVLKRDGSPWECTLVENFDGTSLDRSLWVPQRTEQTGWNNSEECVVDDPDHLEVSDGTLKIHTRKAAEPFTCKSPFGDFTAEYKTASISTWSTFTQAYGRFEFRAKMPDVKVPGIHSALWMWPENDQKYGPWPHSGEIDIAEFYSAYPDRSIPMLHYDGPMEGLSGALDSGRTNYWCTYDPSQWTTYVAEWTTWGITISYGDQVCLRHEWNPLAPLTGSQPFDQPFMLAISQGLGLQGNARTAETPDLATLEVDWVKVWK